MTPFAIPTRDDISARDPDAALWARVATLARIIEGVDLDDYEAVCLRLLDRGETRFDTTVVDMAIAKARTNRVAIDEEVANRGTANV